MRLRVCVLALLVLAGCEDNDVTCLDCDLAAGVPGPAGDGGLPPGGDDGASPVDLGRPSAPDLAYGPEGPWPTADLTTYGPAQGLEAGALDASPDDAQNIWAATHEALYLLRPGETQFRRFTAADGLHIQAFTDPDGNPAVTHITAIAGGHANEVFVGYFGYETLGDPYLDTDAQKALGNADKVQLDASGRLVVTRYLFRCDFDYGRGCWENRSVRRMLYAHEGLAAGHLFIGMNHGVTHVFEDRFGDHIHPDVWVTQPDGRRWQLLGNFYGLALAADGTLWHAGRWAVGAHRWYPDPKAWVKGKNAWTMTTHTSHHALEVEPGYREENRAVAITPDDTVWIASYTHGLSSWHPVTSKGNYGTIRHWTSTPGLPTSQIIDMTADLDGTLWLVMESGALLRFDPRTSAVHTWPGVSGARRIVMDRTVVPRALYVSMSTGIAVIRAK